MSAVCSVTWDWRKGIWAVWPWAQHFSEQGSARATQKIFCCRISNNISFGWNTWGITQFWKTPLELCALTWGYRCFGYWLDSWMGVFHRWRISEEMHVAMKQMAVCLWKEVECGLFSVQLQVFPPSLSSLFDCNYWEAHTCLFSAHTLLVAFSCSLMTPVFHFLGCGAAALDQILVTLHKSLFGLS